MPAIINSAPDCVTHERGHGGGAVDDTADFILQDNYQDCAGFGRSSGDDLWRGGRTAETIYYIVTWSGIVATVASP